MKTYLSRKTRNTFCSTAPTLTGGPYRMRWGKVPRVLIPASVTDFAWLYGTVIIGLWLIDFFFFTYPSSVTQALYPVPVWLKNMAPTLRDLSKFDSISVSPFPTCWFLQIHSTLISLGVQSFSYRWYNKYITRGDAEVLLMNEVRAIRFRWYFSHLCTK